MLDPKKKYLQIALNSTLGEAHSIIRHLPKNDRIIIEAGTPLIKRYGEKAISSLRSWYWHHLNFNGSSGSQTQISGLLVDVVSNIMEKKARTTPANKTDRLTGPYIVADLKCMDRGATEVEIARRGGANAAVALGHAPIETLDAFIERCESIGLDSMIDMMNVDFPLSTLRQLKKMPTVVVLHRGVDEEHFNKEKEIPFHEIARIKNQYDIMIAIAGGDTFKDVQSAAFNDADIVVVWKSFYKSSAETGKLAEEFLKEIR